MSRKDTWSVLDYLYYVHTQPRRKVELETKEAASALACFDAHIHTHVK